MDIFCDSTNEIFSRHLKKEHSLEELDIKICFHVTERNFFVAANPDFLADLKEFNFDYHQSEECRDCIKDKDERRKLQN